MANDKITISEKIEEVTAPKLVASEREQIRRDTYAMLEAAYGGLEVDGLKQFFVVFPEAMLMRVCTVLAELAIDARDRARTEAIQEAYDSMDKIISSREPR